MEAFPATSSGARVGYGRVSTKWQLLDRQIAALEAAGCVRVFTDKKSGKNAAVLYVTDDGGRTASRKVSFTVLR